MLTWCDQLKFMSEKQIRRFFETKILTLTSLCLAFPDSIPLDFRDQFLILKQA
jgi:hypothetical protein